jgi:hypothetical protein
MMFTIAPDELIRMLAATGIGPAEETRAQRVVYLQASRGRVAVGCNDTWAEADSVTWNDGQCRMMASKLFAAVSRYRLEPIITVDVAYGRLRIRHSEVPVLGCCPWTAVSEAEQSDFATD